MRIFVGKLSGDTTDGSLSSFFQPYSPLASCKVIRDPSDGISKGFGFVEIEDNTVASRAIRELNGKTLDGREVVVNEARPRPAPFAPAAGRHESGSRRPKGTR